MKKLRTTIRRTAIRIETHEVRTYRTGALRCSHCGLEVTQVQFGGCESDDRRLLETGQPEGDHRMVDEGP